MFTRPSFSNHTFLLYNGFYNFANCLVKFIFTWGTSDEVAHEFFNLWSHDSKVLLFNINVALSIKDNPNVDEFKDKRFFYDKKCEE